MEEIWNDIKGYEGKYKVSNLGRIKSLRKNKVLKQTINKRDGYFYVGICKDGKRKNRKVHRLIAETFMPNPKNKPTVNHIDGNKENNCISNLEWCSQSENMKHSYRIGLRDKERLREHMRKVGKSKKGLEVRWRK